MEVISRALESTREQREARIEPHLDSLVHLRGDAKLHARPNAEVGDPTHPDGVPVFRSTEVPFDESQRSRERILPPGSTGPLGGPYKMLRTQVLKRLDQLHANSLAIVSTAPGEGKTLTAINLAIAIASDVGTSALLVDFDLRNPSIHRRFGFAPAVGVEDCLKNGRSLHEAMFKVAGYDRLTLLAARERIDNSSELLRSQRTVEAIKEMRARYANRVVIFDLPPVLSADDALAFSRHVQAGLLVVGEGRTQRDDVLRTVELLHELPIVGTVLNGSRESAQTYY